MIISCDTHHNRDICAQKTGEVISHFKTVWVGKRHLCNPLSFPASFLLTRGCFCLALREQLGPFVSCAGVPGQLQVLNTE